MSTGSVTAAAGALDWHEAEARRLVRWGIAVIVLALLPMAAWLIWAPLTAAVVAPAFVKVDLNRRPVQHAEGGIVREVRVRDGQRVKQGDALMVLGDVAVDADLNRLGYRALAERASLARLESEQALAAEASFPAEVLAAVQRDPRLAEQVAKERSLFTARRDALLGQTRLLRDQRLKVDQEIVALRAQIEQAQASLAHQKTELQNNRDLAKEGFVAGTRVSQIEATVSDYGVKLEERRSELARAQQRLLELDLRARSLESEYRQQASDQLKVTALRLSEVEQELRKSTDAASRQVLVAPADGEVIGLRVSAPGTVIAPRETVAEIVPSEPKLVVEARIRTEDINRVQRDQAADIRFTAFNYRTTKLVPGRLLYVSGDRLVDREGQIAYYSALIEADPQGLIDAGDLKLVAGMPAEVFIKGERRSPLAYLMEPITKVLDHAARER